MSNNNTTTSVNFDPSRYEKIPMDLNFSPLREYFEGYSSSCNNNNTPEISTIHGKTKPVGIPGSSDDNHNHVIQKKRRHHKSRRKPLAHTFPDDELEVYMERKLLRQNNSNNSSQPFIVGSLQEKPPVPWPTALITTADSKNRLKNRQTVNWPLLPRYQEDNIFDMENDFYTASDQEDYTSF